MTLIEVLVTSLMVGLIGFTLVGLDAAGKTTADQRRRSQAVQVAQQDQERIKGLSADQIATLDQTRTVTVDGIAFTVTSTGQFISSSAGAASCSSTAAAADYAKVVSTVDWSSNARPTVVEQSLITPRAGGSVIADINDPTGAPVTGAVVNVAGTDQNTGSVRRRGTTDAGGCTIFGALLVGDYAVNPTLSGYVNPDGSSTPSMAVTATAGNTSSAIFSMGRAGSLNATFTTKVNNVLTAGQLSPSVSWNNIGMGTFGSNVQSTPTAALASGTNLYPFTTGTSTYTNNYTAWAGKCTADLPTSNLSFATVSPGTANAPAVVQMPALIVIVNYKNSSTTTRVVPDHIQLTDACGQNWTNQIRTDANTNAAGSLKFPGQPYGTGYTVCADDQGYKVTSTAVANTNWTTGTTVTMTIDSTKSANLGTC